MPDIQIKSKGQFPDIIGAASLFIDSITAGTSIVVELFYSNGESEKQEIVSGSKFVQQDNGVVIDRVVFHNGSLIASNISYHYSTIFGYDETRVIGNVDAEIVGDDHAALNVINGDYYGIGESLAALAGNYGRLEIRNDGALNFAVERFSHSLGAGTDVAWNVSNAALVGAAAYLKSFLDHTNDSSGVGISCYVGGHTSAITSKVEQMETSYEPAIVVCKNNPIVIKPGFKFVLTSLTPNKAVKLSAIGRVIS